jgi:hypothetical protein
LQLRRDSATAREAAVRTTTIPLRQTAAGSTAKNTNENGASSFSLDHIGGASALETIPRCIAHLRLSVTPVDFFHVVCDSRTFGWPERLAAHLRDARGIALLALSVTSGDASVIHFHCVLRSSLIHRYSEARKIALIAARQR